MGPTGMGGRAQSRVGAAAALAVGGQPLPSVLAIRCAMALVTTMSPTAVRTARRNLVQRLDRFVRRTQTEGFQPGPDDYSGGEDAMIWSEYGFAPFRAAKGGGVTARSRVEVPPAHRSDPRQQRG